MGFFSSLMSSATAGLASVSATLSGEVTKFKSAAQVEASLAIVALVAGADGEVEKQEREAGVKFVLTNDIFKAFDRSSLSAKLEAYYGKCTDDISKVDLFDVIGKMKGNDAARSIVKVGIAIAKADGEFEPQEKEILAEVCRVLGLAPSEFPGLS